MRSVFWTVILAPRWKTNWFKAGVCVYVVGRGSCLQLRGPQIRWQLLHPSCPHSPNNQSRADHLVCDVLTEGNGNLQGSPNKKNPEAETKAMSSKQHKNGVLRPAPTPVWRNDTVDTCTGPVPWKRLKWSQIKRLPTLGKSKAHPFCREHPLLQLPGFPEINIT